jgi:hypothetical protein
MRAKQYNQNLQRFLNLKEKVSEVKPIVLNGTIEDAPKKTPVKKKKKDSKEGFRWDKLEGSVRRSNRKRASWVRYDE